jgi:two-component system, LytTR family, sensor kinase
MQTKKIFWHFLFWISYLLLNFFINRMQMNPENFFFIEQLLKYFSPILIFYIVAFAILPKVKNSIWIVVVLLIFSLICHYAITYILFEHLLSAVSEYPQSKFYPKHFLLSGFWWWFHYSLYAWVYWYYHKSINLQAQNFNLRNQQSQLQYSYLKAQINPHFLYNTLAFFHSKAMQFSKETAKGMELLSAIMRYSLRKETKDGLVALADEVEHLNNYIALHQIRFYNMLNIQFNQTGHFNNTRVPPHILITLVENAFKHGVFNKKECPLNIELNVNDDIVFFRVENTINKEKTNRPDENSGIGLSNVKQRLEREYQNKHRFEYKNEGDLFVVELSIYL